MGKQVCIIFICLLMFGCSDNNLNKKMLKKYVPLQTEQLATRCIKLIKAKKINQASKLLASPIRNKQTIGGLYKISEYLNSGTLKSQELVGWNVVSRNTTWSGYSKKTVLEFQQDLSGRWLLLRITILDDKFVSGINVTPLNRPLQEINAFSINKPFPQILFLILAISASLFSLFTLVVCCITKLKKRKWLWIIFIILGFGKIAMNWSSGKIAWSLMSIQLLNLGILRQGAFNPWIVSTSIPLGAILFWTFKKKITKPRNNIECSIAEEKSDPQN